MKHFLTTLLLLVATISVAQNKSFTLTGAIISEEDQEPLESATIYLERIKDSSLVTYTISDKNGRFVIEDKTTDANLRLNISYVGYQDYRKLVAIDSEEIDLGTLSMSKGETLDAVLIKSRAPITIKKDTLEFNVKSFKTKKDATVEDLLKKLPGVEVDDEGNITVNGKEVNKILVNGKPFFGDDPTITTRNLTKEIIEKVQVTDTKTDAQAFAGEDSDGENKTINLTIKEENNKGVFGRVAAGGGTQERYEFAGFFNRFDNDQRLSILVGGNNINSPGFSFGEIQKMFGNARSMSVSSNGSFAIDGRSFGGGQGVVITKNAGANYADTFGKGFDVTADYFYSGSDGEDRSSTQRENILPDARFFTDSNSEGITDNNNHNANIQFNVKIDSTFLINVRPSFSFGDGKRRSSRSEETRNSLNELTNNGTTRSFSENDQRIFENELDVTKRFGDRGSYVRMSLTNEFRKDTSDDFLESETNVFGDTPQTISRNQRTDGQFDLNSVFADVTYRYPIIAKKLFLDTRLSHRNDKRESVDSTFDFNDSTQDFTDFNTNLSTNFSYTNQRTTPAVGVNYSGEKFSGNVRLGYVFRTLENEDQLRPATSFEQDFEAVELNSYINYRFSPKASIYANYSLSNVPPEISQLVPFQDVSDPLNIITGNPNLEPSNRQQMYVGYNAFDFQKGTGFNLWANANFTENAVVANTIVDENFVRNTTYANVDGGYGYYVSASYSKNIKIDTVRSIKYRVSMGTNTNRSINFNNGVEYAATVGSLTPGVSLTFDWKKVLEIVPNYRASFTRNTYDLDGFEDQDFVRHTVGVKTATFLPEKWEWRNDINYNYNPNVADGFEKSAIFWNSTLAYSILKDKGLVTLKVYDLLKQNNNTQRTATQNYIQDSQSLVLQQYFMLSFSWKFNSLGSKGKTGGNDVFFFD